MTTPVPSLRALLQRAQIQQQAARYKLLRQSADRKLINNVVQK